MLVLSTLAGCVAANDASSLANVKPTAVASPPTKAVEEIKEPKDRGPGLSALVREQANTECLPSEVRTALAGVAKRFGEVTVTSTGRKLRKGGRSKSMHLSCRAADFRVYGNTTGMMAWLRQQEGLGGVKRYSNGIIHIDNGPKRSW